MNTRRWIAVLFAVVMVFCLSVSAAAADPALFTLSADPTTALNGETVTISVLAEQADLVADGKLVISYDAAALEFEGAVAGAAWSNASQLSLKANPVEGAVIVAFASVEAAQKGCIVELSFTALGGNPTVSIDAENSYVTGAEGYDLSAEVELSLGHEMSDWYVDTPATCVADGLERRDCLHCDYTETRVIEAFECPSKDFTDLEEGAWYHDAVDYVLREGFLNGMGRNQFQPNTALSRGMMVTILYRMAGSPEVEAQELPYTDLEEGAWYYDAVVWANANEITNGVNATTFAPNATLTRQQLVTFLYRYAQLSGAELKVEGDLAAYADAEQVGEWAEEAMIWAVNEGLIKGMSETTLVPNGNATRAQVSAMIMRFDLSFGS